MISKCEKNFTFNEFKFHSKTMQKPRKKRKSKSKKTKSQDANSKEQEGSTENDPNSAGETISLLHFETANEPSTQCHQVIDIISNHFRENIQVFCIAIEVSFSFLYIFNCR